MNSFYNVKRPKRKLPVAFLLACDAVILGFSLCVFAYFHHVMPVVYAPVTEVSESNSRHPIDETDEVPSAVSEDETQFTNGEVQKTETTYKSANISITNNEYNYDGSTVHVLDIYVRHTENLKTVFAGNAYGRGLRDSVSNMASSVNAIAAVNGDYYGASDSNGAVIRNGVLYRDDPNSEVLVMYYDGSMQVMSGRSFNGESEIAAGAYQAWCFGPSLLDENGGAQTEFNSRVNPRNPRSVIGYYEAGHYCFIAVDGRSDTSLGLTLASLSSFCEELGLKLAYNLDGGQTSVMTFNGKTANNPYKGGRESSDIICIVD